ncbi:hypothetical protein M407DRAFT_190404 [Tulasnella calospora MUT 4182]|uniref:Uncharacterized protein n=1 Tax=Tulasnella calospora MUT 4182 TaxID=1051891 RepID=A0A0C3M1H9_9AGAM|nr:hypothetical protein M407DRAFT_190404 [Tulasnella calospora MUT 4182]
MAISKRSERETPSTAAKFRRRLGQAELNLNELKTMPSDEKVPIDVLEDCVEPRLKSLKSDFEKDANARSHSSFLGLDSKWLQTGRYQNRLAHVELMLYLIRRRSEISRNDWLKIANWQLATYRESCHRLQLSYVKATKPHAELPGVQSIRTILLSTRKAAYAQRDYVDSADIYDAFLPRNVFDHADLRGLLSSDSMDLKAREDMAKIEAGVMAQQPAFPKWCYETYIGYTPGGK